VLGDVGTVAHFVFIEVRITVLPNHKLADSTPAGYLAVAPRLPPFVAPNQLVREHRHHGASLILIRPSQAVARIGPDAVEDRVPARALVLGGIYLSGFG
jgi:hypothetical protein